MTFTQLTERLRNFLRGWLLVLGLKEGLVECATVCIKSVVILANHQLFNKGWWNQEEGGSTSPPRLGKISFLTLN